MLTSLSSLPETLGLFLIGTVLILSGIVLRKLLLAYDVAMPTQSQGSSSKERPVE